MTVVRQTAALTSRLLDLQQALNFKEAATPSVASL
jgi:hypothetical protein